MPEPFPPTMALTLVSWALTTVGRVNCNSPHSTQALRVLSSWPSGTQLRGSTNSLSTRSLLKSSTVYPDSRARLSLPVLLHTHGCTLAHPRIVGRLDQLLALLLVTIIARHSSLPLLVLIRLQAATLILSTCKLRGPIRMERHTRAPGSMTRPPDLSIKLQTMQLSRHTTRKLLLFSTCASPTHRKCEAMILRPMHILQSSP